MIFSMNNNKLKKIIMVYWEKLFVITFPTVLHMNSQDVRLIAPIIIIRKLICKLNLSHKNVKFFLLLFKTIMLIMILIYRLDQEFQAFWYCIASEWLKETCPFPVNRRDTRHVTMRKKCKICFTHLFSVELFMHI